MPIWDQIANVTHCRERAREDLVLYATAIPPYLACASARTQFQRRVPDRFMSRRIFVRPRMARIRWATLSRAGTKVLFLGTNLPLNPVAAP